MPTLTTPHLLPTVAPSDRPCDAADTLCDLRTRLNVLLDGYDVSVATVVAAVPAAQISRPYPVFYQVVAPPEGIAPIPFLLVGIDTDGMVDLNRDSRVIRVNRPGRYWITGWVRVGIKPDVTAFDETFLSILGGTYLGPEMSSTTEIRPSGNATMLTISDMRNASEGTEFALQIEPRFTAGTPSFPIEEATFTAFWVSETP